MNRYYLHLNEGSNESGPFTVDELRMKGLRPDSVVRKEGTLKFVIASQVKELRELFSASPRPPFSQLASAQRMEGGGSFNWRSIKWPYALGGIAIIGSIVFTINLGLFRSNNSMPEPTMEQMKLDSFHKAVTTTKEEVRSNINVFVPGEVNSVPKPNGGYKSFTLTVKNNSDFTIDFYEVDIEVRQDSGLCATKSVEIVQIDPHQSKDMLVEGTNCGNNFRLGTPIIHSQSLGL